MVEWVKKCVRENIRLIGFTVALLAFVAMIGFGFWYRSHASELNQRKAELAAHQADIDSRRADFAQCVAQNDSRRETRKLALITYALVAGVLRAGGPDDTHLHKIFVRGEASLARQLGALKPLDCETYVRPDLPPDSGDGTGVQ